MGACAATNLVVEPLVTIVLDIFVVRHCSSRSTTPSLLLPHRLKIGLTWSHCRSFTIHLLRARSMQGFTPLCARELGTMSSCNQLTSVLCTSTRSPLLIRLSLTRYNYIQLTPGQSEGTYSCENSQTLQHDLKDAMGFDGFVVSDWVRHTA